MLSYDLYDPPHALSQYDPTNTRRPNILFKPNYAATQQPSTITNNMDDSRTSAATDHVHQHSDERHLHNPVTAALVLPLNLLQLKQLGGGGTSTGLIV